MSPVPDEKNRKAIQVEDPEALLELDPADLRLVFPTQENTRRAFEASLPQSPTAPITDLTATGTQRTKNFSLQMRDYLMREEKKAADRAARGPGPLSTSEGKVYAATYGAAAAAAPFVGPLPFAGRIAVMGGVGGGAELITRILSGEDPREAILKAATTAAFFGLAEGAGAGVATAVGKTYGSVRQLAHRGRQAIRRSRGLQPMPEIARIESTSKPFAREEFLEPEARQVYETITSLGGTPQPSQLVEHGLVDITQKILNRSITAAEGQRQLLRLNSQKVVDAIKSTVDQLPKLSRREVSTVLQDLVTGRLTRIKGVAQGYYRQADRILGKTKQVTREIVEDVPRLDAAGNPVLNVNGKPIVVPTTRTVTDVVPVHGVDIRPLKEMARKELKLLESGMRNNPGLERNLKNIIDKQDTITYSSAQQIRTELFETSQQFTLGAGDVVKANKRAATAMTVPLTRSMQSAARNAGPEARSFINQADKIWREEIRGELTQKFITKLVNNQADDVLDAIIASGRPGDIRMIRDIVMKENPRAWDAVQGSFLHRLIYTHAERRLVNGVEMVNFNAKNLLDDLTRIAREDGSVLRELFPGDVSRGSVALKNFQRYLQALESIQRPISGESVGAIAIQLGQAGSVGLLIGLTAQSISENRLAGGVVGGVAAASAYLFLPHMMGRAFRNPEIVKWLTIGAKHSPMTVPGIKASIATLGLMVRHRIFEDEQAEKALREIDVLKKQLKKQ